MHFNLLFLLHQWGKRLGSRVLGLLALFFFWLGSNGKQDTGWVSLQGRWLTIFHTLTITTFSNSATMKREPVLLWIWNWTLFTNIYIFTIFIMVGIVFTISSIAHVWLENNLFIYFFFVLHIFGVYQSFFIIYLFFAFFVTFFLNQYASFETLLCRSERHLPRRPSLSLTVLLLLTGSISK